MRMRLTVAAMAVLTWPCIAAPQSDATIGGDRWELRVSRDTGTFDVLLEPIGGEARSIIRPEGERPWFGYNEGGREVRTSGVAAETRRGGKRGNVTVRCALDEERQVHHEATYRGLDDGVLVISQFAADSLPSADIIRVAPKLDIDVELLTHYAFSGPDGVQHAGAIADLGERDSYAGVGGWGAGDVASGLDPSGPYMMLYNPELQISFGVIFPLHRTTWRGSRTFLQLYHGGANFWYMGYLSAPALRSEHAFVLYLRQTGDPADIHRDAPGLCREAVELISSGAVDAPELAGIADALQAVQSDLPTLTEAAEDAPPSREAWLARLMIRSARQSAETDPIAAQLLLRRARFELGIE
ncbi:MAG TPA: hypothetical protein QGH10_25190 [Armatimonadota bacterium]|nr:hypothetical protein [Armatimonadota bacterium]